ncbi:inorganic phosphate transporter [Aneurinibacillus thermoaerophilus]|uniref:Phosphate transporter n=1 Tax=Aneurinibacillus thermoaerophilus TaxID=143495 RepID=A0A1G8A6A7_ANETH|nr:MULTISPECIES: inorganic phosphate transporter [Aneurinibacillus]AMA74089.1 sulfate permease [Aneurinibacillus sp. XH2]MED0675465.1 inorganic phosphate transporter [Aneurinibacillus thermoaerophilus]MED0678820.1 inorganic phosphate transporter [Aneurinibacillus thermoaerophilus]MED0758348.1 inorganic phosphate transporter [Aneurinibacillus thermoaerophilus]MED0759845.1 inorganic phosphate transporter [Aneurinibacillus thermoaerophilus]
MILTCAAIAIALFFAMNIGASGTAAAMGAAYGGGAIQNKKLAMLIVGAAALLGAVLGGGEVVKTIGGGIISSSILTVEIVIIILASATLTLFIANLMGVPLSTSEVTVGSIVGIGLAYKSLFVSKLAVIISFWIAVPLVSFSVAYVLGRLIKIAEVKWPHLSRQGKWQRWLGRLLVIGGALEAFSAGMNNVANAVGPLVGAGLMSVSAGVWMGGIFVALGAVLLGGKVLETNGKKITRLSLLQGSAVSFTSGGLVIIASLLGIPVPLVQATTCAIMGVGTADNGFKLWQKRVIHQIAKVWIVSPVSSLVVAYAMVHLWLQPNPYVLIVIISVFITTLGLMNLSQTIRKEKSAIHDQRGGI